LLRRADIPTMPFRIGRGQRRLADPSQAVQGSDRDASLVALRRGADRCQRFLAPQKWTGTRIGMVAFRHALALHGKAPALQIGQSLVAQASSKLPIALMRLVIDLPRHGL
jgi:hypothetical protein